MLQLNSHFIIFSDLEDQINSPFSSLLVALQILPHAGLFSKGWVATTPTVWPPSGSWDSAVRFHRGPRCFQLPLEGNGVCTCPLGMWLSPCLRRVMFVPYLASVSDSSSIYTHVVSLSVILHRGSMCMYVSCPFLSYFTFLITLIFTLVSIDFEVFLSKWAAFS